MLDTVTIEDDDFCPECWARDTATQVLEAAVWNSLAAGLDPEEIINTVLDVLGDPEEAEPTIGETVGSA